MQLQITLTVTNYVKKPGTKTVWVQDGEPETKIVPEKHYHNAVDAAPFFRRLGGSETLNRTYTCAGYRVWRIVSTSPDRESRTVREYEFDYPGADD